MKNKRFLPACLAIVTCLVVLLGFAARARADLGAFEAALNPSGGAYEINPDQDGLLWISDQYAGEIWGVDPDSGSYQVYPVPVYPFDARHDALNQYLWWADAETTSNILGRVSTTNGAYTLWQVPGAHGFYGSALDAAGRFWVMGFESPYLYRLDAAQTELCRFTLPSGVWQARSSYIDYAAGYIWLGETANERLLRLSVGDNSLRSWTLPEFSSPYGIAVDEQGNVWYTDSSNNVLARLNPTTDQMAVYELPAGALPLMVAAHRDLIWYTGHVSLGYLDPLIAGATEFIPTLEDSTLTPSCAGISPSSSGSLTITSGTLDWNPASYSTIQEANGLWNYQLPSGSFPYGITGTSSIWFVDTNRRMLGKIPTGAEATACKLQDLDQNLLTTTDRVPVRNWTLYLTIGGVRQMPGQVTGADGCTTWSDLTPDLVYGVEEDLPSEWQALTPTTHSFGAAAPLAQLSHTFINGREMENLFLPLTNR